MMTTSCIAKATQRACSGRVPKEGRVFDRFSQLSIWPGGSASSRDFDRLMEEDRDALGSAVHVQQ